MSLYSIPLRDFIEHWTEDEDFMSWGERIEVGRKELFNFDYPIFDESYRRPFETNFIRQFYTRDIGTEVFELFQFRLETWLRINMPYFNKLFLSELIEYDPLLNTVTDTTHLKKNDTNQNDNRDLDRNEITNAKGEAHTDTKDNVDFTHDGTTKMTSDGTSEGTKKEDVTKKGDKTTGQTEEGTSEDFTRAIESDTPQNRLQITTNPDGTGIIEYASKIGETTNKGKTTGKRDGTEKNEDEQNTTGNTTGKTHDESNGTSHDESNTNATGEVDTTTNQDFVGDVKQNDKLKRDIKETEDYIQHVVGKIGTMTYPEMIMKHRESFLRIENMIHDEINKSGLFMLVYS